MQEENSRNGSKSVDREEAWTADASCLPNMPLAMTVIVIWLMIGGSSQPPMTTDADQWQ